VRVRIDQEADIALAGGLLLFLHRLAIDQLKSLGVTDRPRVPAMTGLIYPPNTHSHPCYGSAHERDVPMEGRELAHVHRKKAVLILGLIASVVTPVSASGGGMTVGIFSDLRIPARPVLEVKSKKVCNLCNDKGYCLDFANRSSCEQNKAIVQKTWDPSLKWSCSCSQQAAPSGGDNKVACCWISGNTGTKICGKEDKIRKSLIISNPGKSIDCAAP
jgi:hypothetical protein